VSNFWIQHNIFSNPHTHTPLPPWFTFLRAVSPISPLQAHFYISLSPSPPSFASSLPPRSPLHLLPPPLFLCSTYCRILMWLVKQLVRLSQLCACRCRRPTPPTTGSPLPLELSSFHVDKLTEEGSSSNIICRSLCIHCFLWPSLDHSCMLLKGFEHRLNSISVEGCSSVAMS